MAVIPGYKMYYITWWSVASEKNMRKIVHQEKCLTVLECINV